MKVPFPGNTFSMELGQGSLEIKMSCLKFSHISNQNYYLNKKLGLFMSFLYNIYKTCSRFYDLFLMISNILLIPTI